MFGMSMGTEASWLLPAALIGLVAALWLDTADRADRRAAGRPADVGRLAPGHRRGVQLHGRDHPSLLHRGAGARRRLRSWASLSSNYGVSVGDSAARLALAVMVAGTGVWAFVLLERTPTGCRRCAGRS